MQKVSVIIPSYNGAPFIGEALQSIADQTYRNWEVIVVEDGTQDGTDAIVDKFRTAHSEGRFRYHRHEVNRGVGPARNTAMALATGEILAFLDCDDFWKPAYLETMVRTLEEKKTDIVFSTVQFFDHETREAWNLWGPTEEDIGTFPEGLFERNYIAPSAAIIRREAQLRVGNFDPDPLIQSCEDHDFWLRCVQHGLTFTFEKKILSWYRKHKGTQATGNYSRILERDLRILRKHRHLSAIPSRVRQTAISNHYYRLAETKIRDNFWSAFRFLFFAWKERPWSLFNLRRIVSVLVR